MSKGTATAETGLEALKRIKTTITQFCELHGKVTEADTRANIIDKILTDVCGWPGAFLQRERHVPSRGYMDYTLTVQHRRFVVRVTAAGWFYARQLAGTFSYLDLVLQDTPLNELGIAEDLRDSVREVDNLYDRSEEKVVRVEARFRRVERFLKYLGNEEEDEFERFGLAPVSSILTERITPWLAKSFQNNRDWISTRLAENRERPIDERFAALSAQDEEVLSAINSEFYDQSPATTSDETSTEVIRRERGSAAVETERAKPQSNQ